MRSLAARVCRSSECWRFPRGRSGRARGGLRSGRKRATIEPCTGEAVAAWVAGSGEKEAAPCAQNRKSRKNHMSVFDLIKATVVCGLTAFVVYTFPVMGQISMIGLLGLL